jgi:hypothetical protein
VQYLDGGRALDVLPILQRPDRIYHFLHILVLPEIFLGGKYWVRLRSLLNQDPIKATRR